MEDILIQFPNNTAEMLVPEQSTIKTVDRRINKRLMFATVSIPKDGIMTISNNNIIQLFFSGESGTITFVNGMFFEDTVIELMNTGTEPARFNYRLLFV